MKGKCHSPTSASMKQYGRGMARVVNQVGGSGKVPKSPQHNQIGAEPKITVVENKGIQPAPPAMVMNDGTPKRDIKIRGTGAATKGVTARGPMG